jgi:hypothetical protein
MLADAEGDRLATLHVAPRPPPGFAAFFSPLGGAKQRSQGARTIRCDKAHRKATAARTEHPSFAPVLGRMRIGGKAFAVRRRMTGEVADGQVIARGMVEVPCGRG